MGYISVLLLVRSMEGTEKVHNGFVEQVSLYVCNAVKSFVGLELLFVFYGQQG